LRIVSCKPTTLPLHPALTPDAEDSTPTVIVPMPALRPTWDFKVSRDMITVSDRFSAPIPSGLFILDIYTNGTHSAHRIANW